MAFNFSPKIVTDGLVLCLDAANTKSYPGSGTVWSDLSRTQVKCTLINGPTFNSANGGSIVFDGTNDYVEPTQFNITSGTDLSLDIIVKINSTQGYYSNIFDYNHGAGGFVLQQYFPFASTEWYFYTGYDFFFISGLPNNQIFHLVITKNGANCVCYINGSSYTSATLSSSAINATGKSSRIGDYVGSDRNFNGSISLFKIYNRALSAQEVLQNYNATKTRFGL